LPLANWVQHQIDQDIVTNRKKGISRKRMSDQFDKKSVGEFFVGVRVLILNPKLAKMKKKPIGVERYSYHLQHQRFSLWRIIVLHNRNKRDQWRVDVQDLTSQPGQRLTRANTGNYI